jgi:hypothetical protein
VPVCVDADETLELRLRYTGAPFGFRMRRRFDGERVTFESQQQVSFGSPEPSRLEGRLESSSAHERAGTRRTT